MSKEVSAGIIIYRETPEGPKFLLLYHGGGYWNFPKGKLEEGERSFRAAVREVEEETGLKYKDLRFSSDYFKAHDRFVFQRGGDKVSKHVFFYLAETKNPEVRVSSEHEGYGWFLYERALQALKYKNLRDILKFAHDVIIRPALRQGRSDSEESSGSKSSGQASIGVARDRHDKFSGKSSSGNRAHSPGPRHNVRGARPIHRAPQSHAGGGAGPAPQLYKKNP